MVRDLDALPVSVEGLAVLRWGESPIPQVVLSRFEAHVQNLRNGAWAGPKSDWVQEFFLLQARWVGAVRSRSELAAPFLAVAGLHLADEVTGLFDGLRASLLRACEELRGPVQDPAGEVRQFYPLGGQSPPPQWNAVELLDHLEQHVRRETESPRARREAVRGQAELPAPVPASVIDEVEWCRDIAPTYLGSICDHLALDEDAPAREALSEGRAVIRRLTALLLEGQRAELWRASYRLLEHYHVRGSDPDPEFGEDVQNWPLLRQVALHLEGPPVPRTFPDEPPPPPIPGSVTINSSWEDLDLVVTGGDLVPAPGLEEAEAALASMRQLTTWLLQQAESLGSEAEDPRELLERFRKHVEDFPDDEFGWEEWQKLYFRLQWRWVEAVRRRPDLAPLFLEAAGVHLSDAVTRLVVQLRDSILEASGILRRHFEQEDSQGKTRPPLRDRWPRTYPGILPPLDDGEQGVLDDIDSGTRSTCNWVLGKGPDGGPQQGGQHRKPSAIRERLFKPIAGDFLPWLGVLNSLSGDAGGAPLAAACKRASDALRKLGALLLETATAERWEAAFHLLCAYHCWNPTPDRAFGPPGEDWPVTANAVALPDWIAFSSHDAHLVKVARKALADMERLTDWLLPEGKHVREEKHVDINRGQGAIPEDERMQPAKPDISTVVRFYRWYEQLRIERERVRRTMASSESIEVQAWEKRAGQVKSTGIWVLLRGFFALGTPTDPRKESIARFCERYPKGEGTETATLNCGEYMAVLEKALDICCDDIAIASDERGVPRPWREGEERAPQWSEDRDRISCLLRDRDTDPSQSDSVAAIQDHAELPPEPEAAEPEAAVDDAHDPAMPSEAKGMAGEPAFTIDEYYEKYGKTDADGTRLVGNVSLDTARRGGRQSPYDLAGKEVSGSGRKGDPYKYPVLVLLDAFPP